MITRPTRDARIYPITTYDFEWTTTSPHRIRLCGAYDERRYRAYSTIEAFLEGELIPENYGRRFYAHFGGASDMVFMIMPLLRSRRKFTIKAAFNSSSAIIVEISEPGDDPNRKWVFLDSFWTMRVGLAKIGKWLGRGFEKGEVDFNNDPIEVLKPYNEQDCRILWEALDRLQTLVLGLGGELGPTIASTALRIILRKYLSGPLENSSVVDDWIRPGYCASKSMVYRGRCETAKYYDINSSFPTSMSAGPLPGKLINGWNALPKNLDQKLWAAKVRVKVKDQYNPPLPFREPKTDRVLFPCGEFDTTICDEDFKCGDFEITKVYSVRQFEERYDLVDFASDMYRLRLESDQEGFESQAFKILANSGYGKWAEQSLKQSLLVRPAKIDPNWPVEFILAPHIYLVEEDVPVNHSHVPWAVWITARSRRYLRELEMKALQQGELYYSDCDAVLSQASFPKSPYPDTYKHGNVVAMTGRALGELKLEAEVAKGRFLGSKLYALELADAKKEEDRFRVKAKGFSRQVSEGGEKKALTYEDFISLEEGNKVNVMRMKRIRELLRNASRKSKKSEEISYEPESIIMQKQIHLGKLRPKRCPLPGNDSRPWNVNELEQAPEEENLF